MNRLGVELERSLGAPRVARDTVSEWLSEWGCSELCHRDVLVVLSELVTNAVVHARSAPVVVVWCSDGRLRIEVADSSAAAPIMRVADGTPGGFGLRFVTGLSDAWGWLPTEGGKTVWAEMAC